MMRRVLGTLAVALLVCGFVVAEDTPGSITKVEDGSITVRTGGFGFGGGKGGKGGKGKTEAEEKTYKVSSGVKITRVTGKDKDEVKLTLAELKTAIKVTNVFATITHEGDNVSEIKIGGFGGFGGGGKGKGKDKKKDD